jgi:hypothetical protein
MTWHSFLDISTMAHRHLLLSYAGILAIQFGYLGRIAWQWHHTKGSPR